MKVLSIILLTFCTSFGTQVYAPDIDKFDKNSKEQNVEQILKLNDALRVKCNYYPHIDTNNIYMDINFMKKSLHKMLTIEAISLQEVGLSFDNYNKLTQNQKWEKAYNKKEGATGNMQIRWVMWYHIVNELKLCNYKLSDRWDASKSFKLFIAFQDYYNPTWNFEKASRDWNGGGDLGLQKTTTLNYYKQVKEKYEKLVEELGIDLS
jgi:hypothetical protein